MVAACLIAAGIAAWGQVGEPVPADPGAMPHAYEVVSIRPDLSRTVGGGPTRILPNGFRDESVSIASLVLGAYDIGPTMESQVVGMPAWAESEPYDVEAKVDSDTAEAWKKIPANERWNGRLADDRPQGRLRGDRSNRPHRVDAIAWNAGRHGPRRTGRAGLGTLRSLGTQSARGSRSLWDPAPERERRERDIRALKQATRDRRPQRRRVVGRDRLQAVRGLALRAGPDQRRDDPERREFPRIDYDRRNGCRAEQVMGRALRLGRQRSSRLVEEQDPGISVGMARRGAHVAQRERRDDRSGRAVGAL